MKLSSRFSSKDPDRRGPPFGIVAVCMYSCSSSKKIKNEISTSPTILHRVKSFPVRPLSPGREGVRAHHPPQQVRGENPVSTTSCKCYVLPVSSVCSRFRYRNQPKFGLGWGSPSINHAASSIRTIKWTGAWSVLVCSSSLHQNIADCLLLLIPNFQARMYQVYILICQI